MLADALPPDAARAYYLEAMKPRPDQPPSWPKANAIKRGEAAEVPRVAEDAAAIIGRAQECFGGFMPSNLFQVWAIDQVSVATLRLDRCGRAERRIRDLAVIRAELSWDDDRAGRAAELGARISKNPPSIASQLRFDPHGRDWLIARWAGLALAAQDGAAWTAEQASGAHDLLGTPLDARHEPPGLAITFEGTRAVAHAPEPAELALREIAALRKRKADATHLDAISRAMVESDLEIEPTPELRRLGRYEASLRGWLRWLVKQARTDAPRRNSPSGYYPEMPQVEPEGPKPEPKAPAQPDPKPEPSATAEAEDTAPPPEARPALPRIAGSTRKDPTTLRDEARDDARRRKRERRRA